MDEEEEISHAGLTLRLCRAGRSAPRCLAGVGQQPVLRRPTHAECSEPNIRPQQSPEQNLRQLSHTKEPYSPSSWRYSILVKRTVRPRGAKVSRYQSATDTTRVSPTRVKVSREYWGYGWL